MNPRVADVKPSTNYTIILTFMNGEVKVFDVKPYLAKGIFKELQHKQIFNAVKPFLGSIQWPNGQDFCPDTLYLDSVPFQEADFVLGSEEHFQTSSLAPQIEST